MAALPDYSEALSMALRDIRPLGRVEMVDSPGALGRVLAEPVLADRDLPPFNRAQMDGYAIRAAEFSSGKSWPVAHVISAGVSPKVRVPAGACVSIATGAALPDDVDAVVQHELSDRGDREGRAVKFTIDKISAWNAVHRRGADAKTGDTLVQPLTVLQPQHIGIAAVVGMTQFYVAVKPRVAIITSGDEVVSANTPVHQVQPQHIRNSNQTMIAAIVDRIGGVTVLMRHVCDELEATVQSVAEAIAAADLVISVGGVSAGDRDQFPSAFASSNVKPSLQGASIQPGRPIFVGVAPKGAVVIGLPGNPVSALVCSCLFVWPIVRVLLGLDPNLPWREIQLAEPVKPNATRRAYRPARLVGLDEAAVPDWAGSGDLAHTAETHGLLELPVQTENVTVGTRLRFLPWP